jgi:hypothetical protein
VAGAVAAVAAAAAVQHPAGAASSRHRENDKSDDGSAIASGSRGTARFGRIENCRHARGINARMFLGTRLMNHLTD